MIYPTIVSSPQLLSLKFREKESGDQIVQYLMQQAGGSFGGNATIATSTRRYCQLCATVQMSGALINFSPESVGLPPLELGYFRGLKGDKWVSAGYLLPLCPPITHPTAASAFTAQVVLSSSALCATLAGKCHYFLPGPLLPPNPQFSHWLYFSSCFPRIKGFRLHKQCFHSSCYYPRVDVNKALSLNRLH